MEPKFQYEFEHHWGGETMWYHKAERWAKKQKFPIDHLTLGLIAWLKKHWIDGKIEMEMQSVDKQAEQILKEWEEDAEKYYEQPEIVERGVFGEESWSISMSNPVVDRGTQEPESSMGTSSNEVRLPEKLPDPWYMTLGDPNDAEIGFHYESRKHTGDVETR